MGYRINIENIIILICCGKTKVGIRGELVVNRQVVPESTEDDPLSIVVGVEHDGVIVDHGILVTPQDRHVVVVEIALQAANTEGVVGALLSSAVLITRDIKDVGMCGTFASGHLGTDVGGEGRDIPLGRVILAELADQETIQVDRPDGGLGVQAEYVHLKIRGGVGTVRQADIARVTTGDIGIKEVVGSADLEVFAHFIPAIENVQVAGVFTIDGVAAG